MTKRWYTNNWDGSAWVFNKALDEVEVPIDILYDVEHDDGGSFPAIYPIATYSDDDGYEQDYKLSENEIQKFYEEVYEAMQEEPMYDEYGGAL
jgi:hypothetical protein